MSIFGELERFLADLYPNRVPITIAVVIAAVFAAWFAYNRGWHLPLLRHKLATALIAVALLAVAIPAGNYLFSPLWERSTVVEASPITATDAGGGAITGLTATPTDARIVSQGEVSGADDFHFGEGTALLIETGPGQYVLRFEEFSVRNGPDLFVYLSPGAEGYEDGAINLGELKATDGAFNYEIPADVDISQFRSAVVWCKRFAVEFASAPLEPVQPGGSQFPLA